MAKKTSLRSRAARRATSPSINTDKSLKEVRPPAKETLRPNVLAVHRSAGITKKSGKRKSQLSTRARRRQEKGFQMAEAVGERTSKKLQRSFDRGRKIYDRSKAWEAVNKAATEEMEPVEGKQEVEGKAQSTGATDASDDDAWETDDEMDAVAERLEEGAKLESTETSGTSIAIDGHDEIE